MYNTSSIPGKTTPIQRPRSAETAYNNGTQQGTAPAQQNIAANNARAQQNQSDTRSVLPEIIRNSAYGDNGLVALANGEYLREIHRKDGSKYYEEVSYSTDVDSVISQTIHEELHLNVQPLVKKVGMNPSTMLSYAWTVEKGHFVGDFGDYLNKAVKYMMQNMFGVRYAMIKIKPGLIDKIYDAQRRIDLLDDY